MLNHLINSNIGFVWAVRATAFISLGCFILGNALIFIPRKNINPSPTPGQTTQLLVPVKRSLWDTPYLLTLASSFLLSLGTNTPAFYVQLFAETKGVNKNFVFNSLAIMNVGSIVGRIIPSWFADKLGAINVYIPLLAAAGEYSEFPEMTLLI
jgi:fucose permease